MKRKKDINTKTVSVKEKKLERKNRELERLNAELNSLVYCVTHDLRAPLMSVQGMINLATIDDTPESKAQYLGMMQYGINKMDDLIRQIHHYYRNGINKVEKTKINFKKLVTDTIDNLSSLEHSAEIRKEININEKIPFFNDSYRLGIVLKNLFSNAIQYYDANKHDSYLRIQIQTNKNKAIIIIEDNGEGVAKTNADKLFDMFFRASEKSTGSGLGLFVVKEIVSRLNGKIKIESKLAIGSTFYLELPNLQK